MLGHEDASVRVPRGSRPGIYVGNVCPIRSFAGRKYTAQGVSRRVVQGRAMQVRPKGLSGQVHEPRQARLG